LPLGHIPVVTQLNLIQDLCIFESVIPSPDCHTTIVGTGNPDRLAVTLEAAS